MKKLLNDSGKLKALLFASFLCFMLPCLSAYAVEENYTGITQQETLIVDVVKINPTTVDILFSNHQRMTLDFYGENIFRVFQDNSVGCFVSRKQSLKLKFLWTNHVGVYLN